MKILKQGIKFIFAEAQEYPIIIKFGTTLEEIREIIDSHTATFIFQDYLLDSTAESMHRMLIRYESKH